MSFLPRPPEPPADESDFVVQPTQAEASLAVPQGEPPEPVSPEISRMAELIPESTLEELRAFHSLVSERLSGGASGEATPLSVEAILARLEADEGLLSEELPDPVRLFHWAEAMFGDDSRSAPRRPEDFPLPKGITNAHWSDDAKRAIRHHFLVTEKYGKGIVQSSETSSGETSFLSNATDNPRYKAFVGWYYLMQAYFAGFA